MMETVLAQAPLLYAGVFVLGAAIGSFLNVVILRVPPLLEHDWRCQCKELLGQKDEITERPPGIVFTRSKCPNCGHGIKALENIPLLSYLFLRGKCSGCKVRISPRYPLVEFLTAVLFVVSIWHFGATLQGLSALFLTACLISVAGIDIDHQLLPDSMTIPLMWTGILLSFWEIHIDLASSVIGAFAGYLVLWSVYHLFKLLTGKEGMGYGDFKLLAALGAWMGWQILPLVVLLSSVVGALVGLTLMATGKLKKVHPIPFGPFIAAAGWIALIAGDRIMDFYTRSGGFG
jgi:leader peptidase (prepilin peptidase)/N-methyltransferase